jgi:hypothetical protein
MDENRYVIILMENKEPYIENINNIDDPNTYFHNTKTKTKYINQYINVVTAATINPKFPFPEKTCIVLKDNRIKYKGMKLNYANHILKFF